MNINRKGGCFDLPTDAEIHDGYEVVGQACEFDE